MSKVGGANRKKVQLVEGFRSALSKHRVSGRESIYAFFANVARHFLDIWI